MIQRKQLLSDDSFDDLGYERQVRNWPVVLQVAGVEIRFL